MSKKSKKHDHNQSFSEESSGSDVPDTELKSIEEKLASWQHRLQQMQDRLKNYETSSQSVIHLISFTYDSIEEEDITS
jgi:uncharacterized protein YlxW (UPF0749 family)